MDAAICQFRFCGAVRIADCRGLSRMMRIKKAYHSGYDAHLSESRITQITRFESLHRPVHLWFRPFLNHPNQLLPQVYLYLPGTS